MGFGQNQTDDDLVLGVQNGSEQAFAQLYKKYEGKLMGYLVFKLKHPEIADEIFQISWTKVLSKIHTYKPNGTFSSWLFTIATNSAKDWFKKSSNQTKVLEAFKNEKSIENPSNGEHQHATLDLDFLKAEAKEVIELQYVQGFSSKEISNKLKITEPNVRKIASKARTQIKNHILNGGSL